MAKNTKKLISDEDKKKIESELEDKYGIKGEDWDIHYVSIKGQEKAFAVRSPSRTHWNHFKKQINGKDPNGVAIEAGLAADCLISDVEGCVGNTATNKEYAELLELKPNITNKLSLMAIDLANSGLDLKK